LQPIICITDATIKPYHLFKIELVRSLAYEGRASLKDRPRCPDVGATRAGHLLDHVLGALADGRIPRDP